MEMKLPELGEGVYEAEFVQWRVRSGDAVVVGQPLAEVMTDKAVVEIPSPFAGQIVELKVAEGDILPVHHVILVYEDSVPAASVSASPKVRQKAREEGIVLAEVEASGPNGRVLESDLDAHVTPAAAEDRNAMEKPDERIPLRGLRRSIAETMARSKQNIPHYGYVDECDVSELVRLRQSLQPMFAKDGVKLTYLSFIVKAVGEALQEVPLVNASLDEAANEIVCHKRYDVGIAVAIEGGLIVPVVKNVDRLSVREIAAEIQRLSDVARSGQVQREDLVGATFTVSSIGGIGGLFSTPIVNPPQVGILGIGKIVRRPVYDDQNQLRPADMVHLSFSFDHRVLDGAVGAAFSNSIIEWLENPARLLAR